MLLNISEPFIAELKKCINNSYAFAYVFVMFAASSAPIMEAAFGRLHKGGTPLVDSIMGAEEAANITKTQANACELLMHFLSSAIYGFQFLPPRFFWPSIF